MPPSKRQPSSQRLAEAAKKIVSVLHEAGHTAYFAGGCVRDMLLATSPSDYDIATDAPPEVVCKGFRRSRKVGEAFGVVLVRLKGCEIEVATFRTEWGYHDGRRPDHIQFTDAEHDALRRDFTINGLFYDPLTERVLDYVGGREDLQKRVIRAIGRPDERFAEDYLRMLRAVRFAARLDFSIGPATAEAIRRYAPHLDRISRERIGMELQMMLEHPARARAAALMQGYGLDAAVLHEQSLHYRPLCLEHLPSEADYPTALAAWLIDRHLEPHQTAGREELGRAVERMSVTRLVRRWRRALTLSNAHRDALRDLLARLPKALAWFELDLAGRKRLLAGEHWEQLVHLLRAGESLCGGPMWDWETFEQDAAELQRQDPAPQPLVTGEDLIAAGLPPGPEFKMILQKTYDAQLNGEVNMHAQAMNFAKALVRR